MISFDNVSKHFGTQDILTAVNFRINPGERVGLVGLNGAGKSTIFELLSGACSPDGGSIEMPRRLRLGYLHQQLRPHHVEANLLDHAENALPQLREMQHEIDGIEHQLTAREAADPGLVKRLGELQSRFEHQGGYLLQSRAAATLSGLGFTEEEFSRPFRDFSGGWQMRAELARVLVSEPDVLLLDEPTNYLDVPAIEWLHGFLKSFSGTLLLVSHDRYLLNSLVTVTLEVASGQVTRYAGNYAYCEAERQRRREQSAAAQKNQARKREQIERFIERFRSKNTKASQVQSRVKMLDKMQDESNWEDLAPPPRIRLAPPTRSGVEVVCLDQAGLTYDGDRWIFKGLNFRLERGAKAALIGPNGRGKTTLLRALAGALPLSEGKRRVGTNVVVGYQSQDFTDVMDPQQTVYQTAKAAATATEAEVRNVLGSFRFSGDAIEKRVEILSGGEKVRLALARLLLSSPNLILLDEPTTHLDIPSRAALEEALASYAGTICIVSHDITFIRGVATTIYEIGDGELVQYYGNYDYYREKKAGTLATGYDSGSMPVVVLSPEDRREQKRQAAKARQEFAAQRKPLEKEAQAAETRVERLTAEQEQLLARMSDAPAGQQMGEISQRLAALQRDIEAETQRWEAAGLAIEELREQLGLPG